MTVTNNRTYKDLTLYSPMEKIFLHGEDLPAYTEAGILRGEETAFQTVVYGQGPVHIELRTDAPVEAKIYRVGAVPCVLTAYPDRHDDDYITTQPLAIPDVLYPVQGDLTVLGQETLWVSLKAKDDAAAGTYPVEISADGKSAVFMLTILPAALPEQTLSYTQWFHVDCIAALHKVEIYSEAHWALIEKYMQNCAEHGQNVILTPVFTPALDTAVGTERPCVQLVEIEKTEAGYVFDFAKLRRWIRLALAAGLRKFEISHCFSQWGATCTPNIYVTENGVRSLKFGWHVSALDPEYTALLTALLPQVIEVFEAEGVLKDQLMFHVSDEPHGEEHLQNYRAAKAILEPLLPGCTIRDALSEFAFYKQGVVEHPVVSSNSIEPFIDDDVPDLWTYTCCSQCMQVGNRFLAMPSNRNRILGVQMWKYGITGFLHWGYNFWYTQLSKAVVDPFRVTDAGGAFPGGDAFTVYPGPDGPLSSIRQKVFAMGLYDMCALQLLEERIGYEETLKLLGEGEDMTFSKYPRTADYLPEMRKRVNEKIAALGE